MPGWTEHRCVGPRQASKAVRSGIVPQICFRLDDGPADTVDEKPGSDQQGREFKRIKLNRE